MSSFIQLPPIKAVVFDFNGTLFDDLRVAYGSVQEIFRTYGVPCPTIDQYRQEISADYMKFYYDYGIPVTKIDDDVNAIRNRYYQNNGGSAQVRQDVKKTLVGLSSLDIRLAIVSAESSVNLYRQLIRAGDIQRFFDFIKPDAWGAKGKEQALLQAAEIFGINPHEMIYVDDSVDGLNSAKNLGVIPVAFANPTGYHSEQRLKIVSELRIQEIGEIINMIEVGIVGLS